jgi:xanthine dehydrogenase accessory factor
VNTGATLALGQHNAMFNAGITSLTVDGGTLDLGIWTQGQGAYNYTFNNATISGAGVFRTSGNGTFTGTNTFAAAHEIAWGSASGFNAAGGMHVLNVNSGTTTIPGFQNQAQARAQPVALFGGGHVGKALIEVLGRLPMSVLWVDSRDEIFPDQMPANVRCEHSDPVQQAVWDLPAGCHVLMMSFSHAEDLDILAACLLRARQQQDLPYIGLIGSDTKWATFRHRLEAKGFGPTDFARVTCPIGIDGIEGKQPEVIAVAVAAQLLQR